MNDLDYGYDDGGDEGADWNSQESIEQERWEKNNDVETILNDDPDYHKWSDDLDRLAERDREIIDLAEFEAERFNSGLTLEAWDRA